MIVLITFQCYIKVFAVYKYMICSLINQPKTHTGFQPSCRSVNRAGNNNLDRFMDLYCFTFPDDNLTNPCREIVYHSFCNFFLYFLFNFF